MKKVYENSGILQKAGKGLIALFALKLILFAGLMVFESCKKGNDNMQKNNKVTNDNFIKTANKSIISLNKIQVTNVNLKNTDNSRQTIQRSVSQTPDMATISVYPLDGATSNNIAFTQISNLQSLTALDDTEIGITYSDGSSTTNISSSSVPVASYQISIEAAKQALQPTLSESKNYLYSKGLTDADITELLAADAEGSAMSESDLIPTVMQMIAEEQNQQIARNSNLLTIFGTSAHASKIGECAGDALGTSAIAGAIAGGLHTDVGKALLKKAIRKVATRALGWVGAAIFAYEFGDCMGWW